MGRRAIRVPIVALVVAAISGTSGCRGDPYALVQRAIPHEDDAVARQFLTAARESSLAAAESLIVPAQRGPGVDTILQSLAAVLGPRAPDSVRAVDLEEFFEPAARRVGITYELAYPDRWVLVGIFVRDSARVPYVMGAQAKPVPRSAANANALTLRGKSVGQTLMALVAVALPIFMLVTAVQVVRSRARGRWLWALFVVIGFGRASMNWTTGALVFHLVNVQILGAGVFRAGGPYLPWVLSVSLPVGAVLAQIRLRRRRPSPIEPGTAVSGAPAVLGE